MKILLATGNMHKKQELSSILSSHTLFLPDDLGIGFDFEETENTFLGNSLGKARALYEALQDTASLEGPKDYAVVADDSGLVIPALDGAPGIYSARYGSDVFGRMLESHERNEYLLRQMKGITDRQAFFVCCMTMIIDDYRIYTVQETMEGTIIDEETGTGGFGYDPVFYLPDLGKTVAQLSADEKNSISHRGKAGAGVERLLQHIETQ